MQKITNDSLVMSLAIAIATQAKLNGIHPKKDFESLTAIADSARHQALELIESEAMSTFRDKELQMCFNKNKEAIVWTQIQALQAVLNAYSKDPGNALVALPDFSQDANVMTTYLHVLKEILDF